MRLLSYDVDISLYVVEITTLRLVIIIYYIGEVTAAVANVKCNIPVEVIFFIFDMNYIFIA